MTLRILELTARSGHTRELRRIACGSKLWLGSRHRALRNKTSVDKAPKLRVVRLYVQGLFP